jgi:hypothetical protein
MAGKSLQPLTMLTVLTQMPAFASASRSEGYGLADWLTRRAFGILPVDQIGRGACSYRAVAKSAAGLSRLAPQAVGGHEGGYS